ncbi:MAG: class II aldolase/adducin family protein [Rhodospirillales bacterium]|nr:class II aldolase/adducin family protein [Rhodospirillales bacterium]
MISKSPREKGERELRINTAAAYRLIALYGMDDLLGTHISCRLPGAPTRFLLNPYGLLFEEITASSLVAVDLDGNVSGAGKAKPNPYGYAIHAAIQGARPDAKCIIHTHTHPGMAVAAMADGLQMLNQLNMMFYNRIAYYDYEELNVALSEGEALRAEESEQKRLSDALGPHNAMIMRNHGLIAVGETMSETFYRMYYLEQSCAIQMNALACNTKLIVPSHDVCEQIAEFEKKDPRDPPPHVWAWEALLRKLDRTDPSFRN